MAFLNPSLAPEQRPGKRGGDTVLTLVTEKQDHKTREPNYEDTGITENTRSAVSNG